MHGPKEEKSPTPDMHSLKKYLQKGREELWVAFS